MLEIDKVKYKILYLDVHVINSYRTKMKEKLWWKGDQKFETRRKLYLFQAFAGLSSNGG